MYARGWKWWQDKGGNSSLNLWTGHGGCSSCTWDMAERNLADKTWFCESVRVRGKRRVPPWWEGNFAEMIEKTHVSSNTCSMWQNHCPWLCSNLSWLFQQISMLGPRVTFLPLVYMYSFFLWLFCSQVESERDDLYSRFVSAIHDVQQKTGLKNLMLEKRIAALADTLEKKVGIMCRMFSHFCRVFL